MRISHEAIYQALFIQGRGALERELVACLRTGRALRVPRARTKGRGKQFVTPEIMITERPAEVGDRAVPGLSWTFLRGSTPHGREARKATFGTLQCSFRLRDDRRRQRAPVARARDCAAAVKELFSSALGFHRRDQFLRTRAPPGDRLECLREGDVEGMNAFVAENVNGSGERRGHRGHEDREAAVLQLFDDERGNEGVFDLGQRRLPHALFVLPCESLSQTPNGGR